MSVSSGWYPDPQDPSRRRWWDGQRWGELAPQSDAPETPRPPAWSAPNDAMRANGPVFSDVPAAQPYGARFSGYPTETAGTWNDPTTQRGRKGRVARDRAVRTANPFGYAGIVLALLAFLINPMAILGILGAVFGGVGLARASQLAGQRFTGFGVSLAGLILGVLATAAFVANMARLLA
jgi:hypothetical protein